VTALLNVTDGGQSHQAPFGGIVDSISMHDFQFMQGDDARPAPRGGR
jgi:hypothetical protein